METWSTVRSTTEDPTLAPMPQACRERGCIAYGSDGPREVQHPQPAMKRQEVVDESTWRKKTRCSLQK